MPSPHTYRAVGHVTLIALTKEKLDSLLEHFPGISKIPPGEQQETPSSDVRDSTGSDARLQEVMECVDC